MPLPCRLQKSLVLASTLTVCGRGAGCCVMCSLVSTPHSFLCLFFAFWQALISIIYATHICLIQCGFTIWQSCVIRPSHFDNKANRVIAFYTVCDAIHLLIGFSTLCSCSSLCVAGFIISSLFCDTGELWQHLHDKQCLCPSVGCMTIHQQWPVTIFLVHITLWHWTTPTASGVADITPNTNC